MYKLGRYLEVVAGVLDAQVLHARNAHTCRTILIMNAGIISAV